MGKENQSQASKINDNKSREDHSRKYNAKSKVDGEHVEEGVGRVHSSLENSLLKNFGLMQECLINIILDFGVLLYTGVHFPDTIVLFL